MSLTVRLIGIFDIRFNDQLITLSSRAAQSLFAYLILTAGTPHRREKLAGMFWPEVSEGKARTYLRQELWRIRKALSPHTKVDYLIADDINISFNSSTEYQLDVDAIYKLSEEASSDQMIVALSNYQGDLLPGFYEVWVLQEREQVQAVYEQKMTRLLELLESEERWPEILEWAERWISLGQGPETAFRYLMVAYDALGDRAKVASTYQRCIQVLRELDLEPSEQTRTLAVKRTRNLNIPIPLTSFIGREKERIEVASLLSKYRLVTLTGSGGVGKTRLAIQVVAEVLDQFPDGVWFLDLAPLSDPALVPNTLVDLLGLHESEDSKLSMTDQLVHYLHSRTALIIFDNCEHLIESCAQLVNSLLTSCESLSILATSREALWISGEIPYRVPSLAVPNLEVEATVDTLMQIESARLFMERVAVISPGFAVTAQNILSISQICAHLDGIPLAIELAAARANIMTVEQIFKRLDDRFNLLTHGLRSALPRHQTLHATIEWSYELLSEQERLLFRRLAVFVGGWTLEAAEDVCSGDAIESSDVLDLLSQLVNKSLLLVEPVRGEFRYRQLETIRQFAVEMLTQSAEAPQLREKHLAYFLKKAEEIEPYLTGAEQSAWMDYLDVELDNIRLALEWSLSNNRGEASLRLFGALGWFWIIHCHFQEGVRWFKRAIELRDGVAKNVQAKAVGHAASLFWINEGTSSARSLIKESIDLYRELGNKQELANRLVSLGVAEESDLNFVTARALYEESLSISRMANNKPAIVRALFNLAHDLAREGDFVSASKYYEEGLAICRDLGDGHLTAMLLINMGHSAFQKGDFSKAYDHYRETLLLSLDLKNKRVTANSLIGFSELLCSKSLYAQSANLQGFAVRLLDEIGAKLGEDDLVIINKIAGALKAAMGERSYRTEYDLGRTLRIEDAVEIALQMEKFPKP